MNALTLTHPPLAAPTSLPISTAPRDGSTVDLLVAGRWVRGCHWWQSAWTSGGQWQQERSAAWSAPVAGTPTHWRLA